MMLVFGRDERPTGRLFPRGSWKDRVDEFGVILGGRGGDGVFGAIRGDQVKILLSGKRTARRRRQRHWRRRTRCGNVAGKGGPAGLRLFYSRDNSLIYASSSPCANHCGGTHAETEQDNYHWHCPGGQELRPHHTHTYESAVYSSHHQSKSVLALPKQ